MKIADFSLSRLLLPDSNESGDINDRCYTGQVATRRYRAPELLFGSVRYDQSIDMWSVGCILAEMQMKTPLFAVSYIDSSTFDLPSITHRNHNFRGTLIWNKLLLLYTT